jgi:hypothetical protein
MAVSNTLTSLIPTIFAQGLQALRSACVMPGIVNNSYSVEAAQKGQTITIPVPSAISVVDVEPGPYAPDPGNLAPTTAEIKLDRWKEAAFTLNESELAKIAAGVPSMEVSAAVKSLAEYINLDIFSKAETSFYTTVGTAGTTPFGTLASPLVSDATACRKALSKALALKADRHMVLDVDAAASALNLQAFQLMQNSGDANVMREGDLGRKFGFDWHEDQQVPTHTAGTITTGLISKASTAVAQGAKACVCTTAASTGACALKAGDIVKFAGDSQPYVLTADATQASAASDVTLNFIPGLKVAHTGSEAVSVTASHVMNLFFHRDALAFASRSLKDDPSISTIPIENKFEVADPVSGLTLRLHVREEFHRIRWAFDALWGVGSPRPELGGRLLG